MECIRNLLMGNKQGKAPPPPSKNNVSANLSDDALNRMLDEKAGIGSDGGPPRGAYPTLELEGIPLDGMDGGDFSTLNSDKSGNTQYGAQHITSESGWDGQSALSGSQWGAQSERSGATQSQRSGATESARSQSQWGGESQRSGATQSQRSGASQSQWGGESQRSAATESMRSGTAESMRSGATESMRSGATESMRSQNQWDGQSQRSGATESMRSQSQYGASDAGMSSLYDDRSLPTDSSRPPTLPDRTPGMFVSGRSKAGSMFSRTSRATSRAPSTAASRAPSTATSRAPSSMGSNMLMPKESKMSDFNADQRFSEAPSVRDSAYSEYSEYEEGSRAPMESDRSRWTESTGYSEYTDYPDEESRMSAMSGISTATGQLDGIRSVSQGPFTAGSRSVRGSKQSTRTGMRSNRTTQQSRGASVKSSRSNMPSTRSSARGSSRRTARSASSVWTKGGKGNTMRQTRGGLSAGIPENELYEKDSLASGWTDATGHTEATGYTEASRAQSRVPSTASDNNRESMGWSGTEAVGENPKDVVLGGHSRFRKNDNGQWKATQSTRNNFVPTAFRRVTVAVGALGFGGLSKTGKTARHHDKARDYFKSVKPQGGGSFASGPPPNGKLGPGRSSWSGSGGSSAGIDVKRVVEGSVRQPMPSQWGRAVPTHWKNKLFGGGK